MIDAVVYIVVVSFTTRNYLENWKSLSVNSHYTVSHNILHV